MLVDGEKRGGEREEGTMESASRMNCTCVDISLGVMHCVADLGMETGGGVEGGGGDLLVRGESSPIGRGGFFFLFFSFFFFLYTLFPQRKWMFTCRI